MTNKHIEITIEDFNAMRDRIAELESRLDVCKQYFLLDTLGSIDEVFKRFETMYKQAKKACGIEVKND